MNTEIITVLTSSIVAVIGAVTAAIVAIQSHGKTTMAALAMANTARTPSAFLQTAPSVAVPTDPNFLVHQAGSVAPVPQPKPKPYFAGGHSRPLGLRGVATPNAVAPGEDSVSVAGMDRGLDVYCGYIKGTFTNYDSVKAAFPGRRYIAIAPRVGMGGPAYDCLDVEAGDATPQDCPAGFHEMVGHTPNINKPMFYASRSNMGSVISELSGAGITRSQYYLFDAEWDGVGDIPSGFDAHQWINRPGNDGDVFETYIFDAPVPPPPPPNPGIPTGMVAHAFSTVCQVNAKWDATKEGRYIAQIERLTDHGWELTQQHPTSDTLVSFENLAPRTTYRWRVNGGDWSDWHALTTP